MQSQVEVYFCVSCGVRISISNSTELKTIPILCARCRIGKQTTYREKTFHGYCNFCGNLAHVTAHENSVSIMCSVEGTRTIPNSDPWPHETEESYFGKDK